jgi:hypothetical protein
MASRSGSFAEVLEYVMKFHRLVIDGEQVKLAGVIQVAISRAKLETCRRDSVSSKSSRKKFKED